MTCDQVRLLLGAYLDNELDLRSSLEIEAHVADCAGCRAALEELRALQMAARAHLTRFEPTPGFEARLAAILRPRARPRLVRVAATGMALAAAAAFAFVLVPSDGTRDKVLDAHVRSLLANHATDVLSSDKHTVKPWFQGKLDFGVPVADFADSGFPLVGGRLDYLDGHQVAALVYHRRNHTVNVFIWPATKDTALVASTQRGFSTLHWASGGLTWWLVTDAPLDDLRELRALLTAAQ